jgi:hypothetical protein
MTLVESGMRIDPNPLPDGRTRDVSKMFVGKVISVAEFWRPPASPFDQIAGHDAIDSHRLFNRSQTTRTQ